MISASSRRCSVPILDVGGVDQGVNQIAFGIGQDMPLAALDLLARVIAPRPAAFRGFDALAVDHVRTERRLATIRLARTHEQIRVEALPRPVLALQVDRPAESTAVASPTAGLHAAGRRSPRQSAASAICVGSRQMTVGERTAPAPPIPRRSNCLAKPAPRGHHAREWYRSTSSNSVFRKISPS